jgi:phage terminase large subunit GpA-like protein
MSADHALRALRDMTGAWSALKPPNRVSVSEGAARSMKIVRPGGGSGPWKPAETPYMVEPMDALGRRGVSAVCFVGGAQAGKTVGLIEGFLTHAVVNDPGDMLIVQMTQDKAREYSKQRIDRLIRNSADLKSLLGASSADDNTHDKAFKNGMWVRIAWPTVTNLSSTSYRYVAGTDYDRWPDDIDGEGDGFTLMRKRTTTFMSRGKAVVESTPGREVKDPHWRPTSAHEAPPVGGILGIYNTSDRRRRYWQCPHCGEFMQAEPGLGLFRLPPEDELLEGIRSLNIDAFVREYARLVCPANGCFVQSDARRGMEAGGLWLPEGVTVDAKRRLSGTARVSDIAGFWLGGVSAAYLGWHDLLQRYLQALLDYSLTGQETKLLSTVNTDQGMPYTPRAVAEAAHGKRTGDPRERTEDDLERYVAPAWARFLIAAVDVQGGKNARFIVQVHAVGEHKEQALIDRYAIVESARDGYGGKAPLDPAAHGEDWDVLTSQVIKGTYRVQGSDRELRVHRTIVDTGGEDGVTERAYAWFRSTPSSRRARKRASSIGSCARPWSAARRAPKGTYLSSC